MNPKYAKPRIPAIDIARFYAMALVFYGHFIERVMYLDNPTAAAHYKFIYSFHMLLFIILAGYMLNWQIDFFNPIKGRVVGWNFLFVHEAIPMYAFYLAGVYLQRKDVFKQKAAPLTLAAGIAITFLIVLFTYQLNTGPFSFAPLDAVAIMLSSHGNFIWLPTTAIAGSFMILFIAQATPVQQTLLWMGQNSLILMCLNGIFYHYINPPAAKWVLAHLSGSPLTVFGAGCVVTIGSLFFCMPLIHVFNKYLPQLVGKPKIKGPLLKNLIPPFEARP